MKVYIVKRATGEYEDYSETIEKVFLDEEKAKKYIENENDKLPLAQVEKCNRCECKLGVESNKIKKPNCFYGNRYSCNNYLSYTEIYPLFMEEYEVEV